MDIDIDETLTVPEHEITQRQYDNALIDTHFHLEQLCFHRDRTRALLKEQNRQIRAVNKKLSNYIYNVQIKQ